MPTTKHHMRSILAKTGAANRRELLSMFYQRRAALSASVGAVRAH